MQDNDNFQLHYVFVFLFPLDNVTFAGNLSIEYDNNKMWPLRFAILEHMPKLDWHIVQNEQQDNVCLVSKEPEVLTLMIVLARSYS